MFSKILLAIDGSQPAEKAVTTAIEVARQQPAAVVVFHAHEHQMIRGAEVELETTEEAGKLVGSAVAKLKDAGIPAEGEVKPARFGHVAQAILDEANSDGYDLVVMGSRGLSDLKGLFLGSVTHKVIHLSPKPVLIVR